MIYAISKYPASMHVLIQLSPKMNLSDNMQTDSNFDL